MRTWKTIEGDTVLRESGWPMSYSWTRCEWSESDGSSNALGGVVCFSDFDPEWIAGDAVIGLGILIASATALEYLIRRRER